MNKLIVRRYKRSDQKEVIKLQVLAMKQVFGFVKSKWARDLKNIEETFLKEGEFLVGEYEGKIVAMGALRKAEEGIGEIKRMRVHPNFQGQGFGQMLLTMLENKSKELGFKKVILDTTVKQTVAQNLYIKNGYIETHRRMIESINTENIHYEKSL